MLSFFSSSVFLLVILYLSPQLLVHTELTGGLLGAGRQTQRFDLTVCPLWLPIELKIEYKLSLLCLKVIVSDQARPLYLSELLHLYTTSWQFHSSADT